MAYKSQITNKYMGATFKGAPKSNTVTELGQIVDALRQDLNPALNKFASAKVDKQQAEAATKVQGLYASGKSAEEIATEIENGLHPDLEHKYTAAVVDGYFGKFEAAKSIKQIEKALEAGDYDFTTDSLETFWKSYLPKFTEQSSAFTTGFATVFNEYKANALVEDAKKRGKYWEDKKIEGIHEVLDAKVIIDGKHWNATALWQEVNTYRGSLPKVDGYKENAFISKETTNQAMYLWAFKKYQTATTLQDLEIAKAVLNEPRITKKGQVLPSLLDTGKKEYSTLIGQIESKMISLESWSNTKTERKYLLDRRNGLIDIFAMEDGDERRKAIEVFTKAYPESASTIALIAKSSALNQEKKGDIANITKRVINGEFNWKDDELNAELVNANATYATMTSIYRDLLQAERTVTNGWENPYEDTAVNDIIAKLAKVLTMKMPIMAKYEDGKGEQILSDLVSFDVQDAYIKWLQDPNNQRPNNNAQPQDKLAWERKKREFLKETYNESLQKYDNDAWRDTLKNRIMLDSENVTFDLDDVPTEYYTEVIKETVTGLQQKDAEGKTKIQKLAEAADKDLTSVMTILQKSDYFNQLITSAGFEKLISLDEKGKNLPYPPTFQTTILQDLMKAITDATGIEVKDYSVEIDKATDSISAFTGTISLPDIVKNDWTTWGTDEKADSTEARRRAFKTGLETIIGREATHGLLYTLTSLKPNLTASLAQAFNMSSEEFEQMVEEYLK